ncbi:MAG: NAD(P)H-dependent glycerol-3-phosphate dehydrogenase, partial [Acetomicrobium sp.]
VIALPTQAIRGFLNKVAGKMTKVPDICNVAKGIEIESMSTVSGIVKDVLGDVTYSVLSGPSHAEEVIQCLPTAVVVASSSFEVSEQWQAIFSRPTFRVYTSNDVSGVEIGGAVKNVIAIAAGIVKAMELGDNTIAALVSRGLAEIMRLGARAGANPLTLSGLAGVGDLVVTCFSDHSRNMRLGLAIGRGKTMAEALSELGQVAEGIYTAKALKKMGENAGVELPIVNVVYDILYNNLSPAEALRTLLLRDLKPELPPAMQWM